MSKILKCSVAVLMAVAFVVAIMADADARGRKGSKRVGGHNSHGKGSHYTGGR